MADLAYHYELSAYTADGTEPESESGYGTDIDEAVAEIVSAVGERRQVESAPS